MSADQSSVVLISDQSLEWRRPTDLSAADGMNKRVIKSIIVLNG
jgi:hypothetical protein